MAAGRISTSNGRHFKDAPDNNQNWISSLFQIIQQKKTENERIREQNTRRDIKIYMRHCLRVDSNACGQKLLKIRTNGCHRYKTKVECIKIRPSFPRLKKQPTDCSIRDQYEQHHYNRNTQLILQMLFNYDSANNQMAKAGQFVFELLLNCLQQILSSSGRRRLSAAMRTAIKWTGKNQDGKIQPFNVTYFNTWFRITVNVVEIYASGFDRWWTALLWLRKRSITIVVRNPSWLFAYLYENLHFTRTLEIWKYRRHLQFPSAPALLPSTPYFTRLFIWMEQQ